MTEKTLTGGNNQIDNNHIYDFGNWIRTYTHAIKVSGVGSKISHNLIHDTPHEALYFCGNDHIIEYNEIHSVTKETGDSGAIHTGRDWTWRGTVLRYNYIHHLTGPGLHGVMGIYLDDFMSGTTIYGNIFLKAGRAAFIGGGRDNLVKNNIFIECKPSVHIDARGTSWASYYLDGNYPVLFEKMDAMSYDRPPYSDRYPELLSLYEDDPAIPKNNKITSNISFGGQWLELHDHITVDSLDLERNYIADPLLGIWLIEDYKGDDPYFLDLDNRDAHVTARSDQEEHRKRFREKDNILGEKNIVPAFREGNFEIDDQEIALEIGFSAIPFKEIGLYKI